MKTDPTRYRVIDTQTGKTVGTYANAQTARAARDRLDLRYGAIRYRVQMPVFTKGAQSCPAGNPQGTPT